jgi:hypothetical protein
MTQELRQSRGGRGAAPFPSRCLPRSRVSEGSNDPRTEAIPRWEGSRTHLGVDAVCTVRADGPRKSGTCDAESDPCGFATMRVVLRGLVVLVLLVSLGSVASPARAQFVDPSRR